ncbi:hypothetical protein XO10_04080 [Marinitoga sp. 1135]|uniref:LysM domain-containing protein n=1 Tax=Marinitoga piezophila (strain DSM 14283 / JCM 11233 / KA3) TaxID=443254 RepID=H2J6X4_MARPK|nr:MULTISPECIES: LysM domain-containing protein [Marinitoga]AEX85239.1 LysM domain-containing protein [Marinitoga piezophila KA3]NUU95465.1 hypothetical protein [Marinitoga sp. 1135]NUU97393.1 hypothetical protein [Marinitoga sp. 1138]
MRRYVILIIMIIFSILSFSITFMKSNEGYYELPSYKNFYNITFNENLFDYNMPLLVANLIYKDKEYYMPYTKYLYNNNEVFVMGIINTEREIQKDGFVIQKTDDVLKKYSKEIRNSNISILILYENISVHGEIISSESTDMSGFNDFSFIIRDTNPRDFYAIDENVFEKYYQKPILKDDYIYYKIKEGDTLYKISRIFGVSVDYLLKVNNLKKPELIKKDMYIIVGNANNIKLKGE